MAEGISLEELCKLANISYNERDYDWVDGSSSSSNDIEVNSEHQQFENNDGEEAGIPDDALSIVAILEVLTEDNVVDHGSLATETVPDDGVKLLITEGKVEENCELNDGDWQPETDGNDTEEARSEKATEEKKRPRKFDPENWKRNKNKKRRMEGKAYEGRRTDESGEHVTREPREMGPRCECKKAKSRDCKGIDDAGRQQIFSKFWSTLDWKGRKVYVQGLVDLKPVQKRTAAPTKNPRRTATLFYHLKVPGADSRQKVCKNMFLSTLGLGEWSVLDWVKDDGGNTDKNNNQDIPQENPKCVDNAKNHERRDSVKKFLDELPKVPSHYCRSSSNKLYLEPLVTSMTQLHELYSKDCDEKNIVPACRALLVKVFYDMNLSLYHPRKDQCDICCAHKAGNMSDTEWDVHRRRKDAARNAKAHDKEEFSGNDSKTLVITMDLQALLLCPRLDASALFYKTKLGVHNFTIYNMNDSSVLCYVWYEGEGGLSANEFTSCIIDFLNSTKQSYHTYIIWSDGCGYQNRNTTLANALLRFAKINGKTVIQKILERGHTQMEVDSVHSKIEAKLKYQEIYCPSQYVAAMAKARKKPYPYSVKYIDHKFFQDYSSLTELSSIRPGSRVGDPTVNELRCIRYSANGSVHFKLHHDDDNWSLLPVARACRRQSAEPEDANQHEDIPALYKSRLKIKLSKWKHLQELKCVIPKDYHAFYDTLPHQ